MYLKIRNVHVFRGLDKNRKYFKFEQKLMRYTDVKYSE